MRIYLKVKPVGLATIGWSFPSAIGVDLPIARKLVKSGNNIEYRIYIPGSSFKGALRSATSRIAEAYGFSSCGFIEPELINEAHKISGVCDVCSLFGYPGNKVSSPLSVTDFELVNRATTFTITRTKINDESLKAEEGALYKYEHLSTDAEFKGFIEINFKNCNNVKGREADITGLILLGLAELRLDRMGRRSLFDLKLDNTEELKKALSGTKWDALLHDLERWLWYGAT